MLNEYVNTVTGEMKYIGQTPNKCWAQINLDPKIQEIQRKLCKESPSAWQVWSFLMQNLTMHGFNRVICSITVMSEATGLSKPTVYRSIKLLHDRQFIKILKCGSQNVYVLNAKIVWRGTTTGYEHAGFPAWAIVSKTENTDFEDKEIPIEKTIKSRIPQAINKNDEKAMLNAIQEQA